MKNTTIILAITALFLTSTVSGQDKAIKFDFLAPATNNLTFGYEQSLNNLYSFDIRIGIIGIGASENYNNESGVFLKGGPKIFLNEERKQALNGTYIKPELAFSLYSTNEHIYYIDYSQSPEVGRTFHEVKEDRKEMVINTALLFNLGTQFIIHDRFLLDLNAGAGYSIFIREVDETCPETYYYSHIVGSPEFPIALSAGFSFGYVFK